MSKVLDLVKGHISVEVDDESIIMKGRKPPSGYAPIPGTKHGGFRKRNKKGWTYWYPDEDSADNAAQHHGKQKRHAEQKLERHKRRFGVGRVYGGARQEREELERQYNEAAEHARGSSEALNRKTQARLRAEKKKKLKQTTDKIGSWDSAPKGQHYIAAPGGGFDTRDTIASKGIYRLHKEKKGEYTVTHGPTGLAFPRFKTKAKAMAGLKLAHELNGDAGSDSPFGKNPNRATMEALKAAYLEGHARGLFKKSDNDSKPIAYRMGSVTYYTGPAYELPDGGQVRRPGLDPAMRAQPPVIDDGRDPYISELARLSGRLVNPNHGILAHVHGHGQTNNDTDEG